MGAASAIPILESCGQRELIDQLNQLDSAKRAKVEAQILRLEKTTNLGLASYVERAKQQLEQSKSGVNPYAIYKPEIPTGYNMQPGTEEFDQYESAGLDELAHVGLVLIAGGLGERLGYSGIKLQLPVSILVDDYCYLRYYCEYIKACEERTLRMGNMEVKDWTNWHLPFCIMVSDDTHDKTIKLLEDNNYFGLDRTHVDIIKQENVPALADNDGKFVLNEAQDALITKPHGHGDVHSLLYSSGVASKWLKMGKRWMMFIQDTNALAMKTLPSVLGVSAKHELHMNSVCVPRKPGEQMGAICKLVNKENENDSIIINVEYNQLDALLRADFNEEGDVANDDGYSHFPGNTNTLVFDLKQYCATLQQSQGQVPEFVNPKYANEEKTVFKSPTRLECMMQDYPKMNGGISGNVGFTTYDYWYCYSPAKNNRADAQKCIEKGIPSSGAAEAEFNFFNWTRKMIEIMGFNCFEDSEQATEMNDASQFAYMPRIFLDPNYAITYSELKENFEVVVNAFAESDKPLTKATTLLLMNCPLSETRAPSDRFEQTVILCDAEGANVIEEDTGAPFKAIEEGQEDEVDEIYRIRGYYIEPEARKAIKQRIIYGPAPTAMKRGNACCGV